MATALIVIPIALAAAADLGVDVRPVLMSVTIAASAAYLTPVATPVNLMVMGPAGYRFGDRCYVPPRGVDGFRETAMPRGTGRRRLRSIPSVARTAVRLESAESVPADTEAVGVPVTTTGDVNPLLGLDREALASAGFEAGLGQTLLVPPANGPVLVAVGLGDPPCAHPPRALAVPRRPRLPR